MICADSSLPPNTSSSRDELPYSKARPRRLLADEFQAGDQQVDGLDRDVGFGGRVFRAQRGHVLLEVLGG